ncbi:M18 family aminopeptidase [Cryobacterium psychrophilum]|uniref:M18 family aminopeptidase n=1 Tax=Cryobacterium psychrophilum TaxID=41988 RepID=A0A4Y8KS46_9MICO|nr:M18 family aminopeptidase [Cryobacterium psychrophilum]TDW29293.1 aspartyl aminopeptidase [Cryobacterium psychrophilum]TFD79969.1 M18 family aminopeptidase [Cryobacterium psychrophilum]
MDATPAYLDDFARFIIASPSSYHAANEVARRLEAEGFTRLSESDAWSGAAGGHFVLRDGAIIAWVQPGAAGPATPFRVLGAHTDSPGFKLKPKPTISSHGWLQAGVEVYGGPLLNSWLDRELELAGRLVTKDGTEHLVRTGPFLRIPQLAVHLDREVNNGLVLDRQRHMTPVFGVGDLADADLVAHLAALAGVLAADVAGYDILTADTQPPATFGQDGSLFAAGRMDNLSSVHAGLCALIVAAASPAAGSISVLAAFDHEEIGSASRSGASGPLLDDVLTRIAAGLGASVSQRLQAYAESWCLSADTGHAVHPNYSERHDPANTPRLGGGPLLKINANQRYATDAVGAALWARTCEQAGVEYQEFVSSNVVPCGSTIGPLTATRLGIRTVDVGVPLLSMHSARELCHVNDPAALSLAIVAFFTPEA